MKCPRCKFRKMKGVQPVNKELGLLPQGLSCPICGEWVEPDITPLKAIPNKFEFSEEKKEMCRQNLAKGRETKKQLKSSHGSSRKIFGKRSMAANHL